MPHPMPAATWMPLPEEPADLAATLRPPLPLSAPTDDEATVVEELVLKSELGRGGMGVVYLGRQCRLGRDVAVKILREDASPQSQAQLLREARITGRLEHPNVVPIHDSYYDHSGCPQLVLKRIDGVSWGDLIGHLERLPREATHDPFAWHLGVLQQVCNAVAFAHDHGVLHRDLKPDNVMVGVYGEVYLLDWGIAVPLDPGARVEVGSNGLAGTPFYMAPEMFRDDPTAIGRGTDIYLLGGMLYTLLAGHPPRQGGSLQELFDAAETPPTLDPSWPADLRDLLTQCFALDPTARPDVLAFQEALRLHLIHRDRAELLKGVQQKLADLQDLVRAPEGANPLDIYNAYGACHFGLQEVLRKWPHNQQARRALQQAVELMVEVELARGEPQAARVHLGHLPQVPPELESRVDEALSLAQHERNRLERLDLYLDPKSGRLARYSMIGLLAMVWVGLPLLLALLGVERSPARILFQNASVATVLLLIGALFWRAMAGAQLNRNFWLLTMCSPTLGSLLVGLAWWHSLDITVLTSLRTFLDVSLLFIGSLVVEPRLFPGAVIYGLGALIALALPAYTTPVLVLVTIVLLFWGVLIWALPQRRV